MRAKRRAKEGFFPIRIASLLTDTVTDFDLYLEESDSRPPILYRERNLPFTEEVRLRLKVGNVEQLYVSEGDTKVYSAYLERNLQVILNDPAVEMTERAEILYSTSREIVKGLLEDPRSGDVVARSQSLVEHAVPFVFNQAGAFKHLLEVTSFDYYTYTHCVNVFVFSIALARKLGLNQREVMRLGSGALLHDLGKCMIDQEIVNARGKLTQDQWSKMMLHPVYGHKILREQGTADPVALDMVRHHHEKLSGKGYPDGLAGDEISCEVRISTIADVFDALTTRRSYKDAIGSFPALKLMRDEIARDLDPDMFRTFVGMMGNPD